MKKTPFTKGWISLTSKQKPVEFLFVFLVFMCCFAKSQGILQDVKVLFLHSQPLPPGGRRNGSPQNLPMDDTTVPPTLHVPGS